MILDIILYCLFIALAAMFKAASDNMADHYDTSIFSRYNPQFWDKRISSNNKWIGGNKANGHKKGWQFWDPISDAWHISNGAMISSFIAAGIFYPAYNPFIVFVVSGVLFTIVFNTFYNQFFKK